MSREEKKKQKKNPKNQTKPDMLKLRPIPNLGVRKQLWSKSTYSVQILFCL